VIGTKDSKLLGDQDLMRAVAAGEPRAKRSLVTQLYRRVTSRARYLCRNDSEAEDVTQEVILEILESAGSFRADGCLEAWADVITARTVARKMGRVRHLRWLLGGEWQEPASPAPGPEHALRNEAGRDRVARLLDRLPPERRMVVVLKLMYGHSAAEVAEMTGLTVDKVRYHLKHGRAEIRYLAVRDPRIRELFPEVTP
jgi:RNA polymerase sigma-70 factor (ECF subfamily)